MTKPIPFDEFISGLNYVPVHIFDIDINNCYFAEFNKIKGFEITLYLCNSLTKFGEQNIYFEVLDLRNYKEGEMIGSKEILFSTSKHMKTKKDVFLTQKEINLYLSITYNIKNKKLKT